MSLLFITGARKNVFLEVLTFQWGGKGSVYGGRGEKTSRVVIKVITFVVIVAGANDSTQL